MAIKTPEIDLRENFGKNYIINGDMRIAQRGTSFPAIANAAYSLDRWIYQKSGAMVHTVSQGTDVPTLAQAGYLFINSLVLTLTTPDDSIAAAESCRIEQRIEGYNWANLAQKPFTISFWVKATLPGVYCVSVRNAGADRSFVAEYTINTSNTWEYKTVSIAASPVAGTWNYTNGVGLAVVFALAAGSDFQTTAGTWQTGNFFKTSNQVNGVATGATSLVITGVQVNEGVQALPFRLFGGDIQKELGACQRYYEIAGTPGNNVGISRSVAVGSTTVVGFSYKVNKRAIATVSIEYDISDGATNSTAAANNTVDGFNIQQNISSGSFGSFLDVHSWTADAEL